MDDFAQSFGQRIQTPIEEAWHNEQKRKQYDIIRVFNPTSEDFYVMYDINQYQKVPANQNLDVPRYIAIRYITHMKDKIINEKNQKMHDDYLKERDIKGLPRFKNKAEENAETYETSSYPRTNDSKVMGEIIDTLWVGLVHEFGRDVPPTNPDPRSGEVDLTSNEMKILEGLEKRRVSDATTEPIIPVQPSSFSQMNQALSADEITNNE